MKQVTYYAIFSKEGKGYNVTFPDIFGGVTCGDDFEDAKAMAEDLLKIMLTSAPGQCFEPSSEAKVLEIVKKDELVIPITVNLI